MRKRLPGMPWPRLLLLVVLSLLLLHVPGLHAAGVDEFKIKRQEIFEFTSPPRVTRDGDRIEVSFESKGFCDVTVAIENAEGSILRHLASGVLGPHAPEPFQKDSLKQTVIWDGKDDQGHYLDDKDSLTVRVALGLAAQFERSLYWSPHKRISYYPPLIQATPEGVYVCEGLGVDTLRRFDHAGNYDRTVYPFPVSKLEQVQGLDWQTFPQTDKRLPLKGGPTQATLLTSGTSGLEPHSHLQGGFAASAMAVQDRRIALAYVNLNRLATDGTTGGLPLQGPRVDLVRDRAPFHTGPASAAFSPDGSCVYLTGYFGVCGTYEHEGYSYHGVYRLAFEGDQAPQVFAGHMNEKEYGSDQDHFAIPTSVACDSKGRVYVADYLNDRIQIFDAAGKYLSTLKTPKPAKVQINPRNQEIFVFSWGLRGGFNPELREYKVDDAKLRGLHTLTRFGSLDKPTPPVTSEVPLPPVGYALQVFGPIYTAELDFWAESPTLWVARRNTRPTALDIVCAGGALVEQADSQWLEPCIQLFREKEGKWIPQRNFAEDAKKAVVRLKPPEFAIQRLYVNPKNHKLYLLELFGADTSSTELLEIDPVTNAIRPIKLPFRVEDICFDLEGRIYLRADREVVRYSFEDWREIPWDYGEERDQVKFYRAPSAPALSALPLPSHPPNWVHQYGMWVSPKGHLAVSCVNYVSSATARTPAGATVVQLSPAGYTPPLYPGRGRHQEIHVWDKHGKIVYQDAIQGLGVFDGLGMDRDDNLYVMVQGTRVLDGKPYFNKPTGTLMKFKPRQGRVVCSTTSTQNGSLPFAPVPLPASDRPKRPPDTVGGGQGEAWVDGAEWFYGGLGFAGRAEGRCNCTHSRFTLDLFARSFAPATDRYCVEALDTNGNLIMRIGQYGNVDSAGPRSLEPLGGDEVGLIYPLFVGADTDRRLFIADMGNQRLLSVALKYHKEEKISLRGVPNRMQGSGK